MSNRVLIAGVGNIFFGDDAFGSEVARRLLHEQWPEDVRVVDFGIRCLDLTLALLDGYDTVILLDATPRGGAPGSLYTIEPELEEREDGEIDAHGLNPMRVLSMAKAMGAAWKRLLVVGCEPSPDSFDPECEGTMGLSDAVRAAVEEAVAVVRRLI